MLMGESPRWLSVSAYARTYGIDRSTVYKWLADGLLITYRVGRLIRVKDQRPLASKPERKH